MKNGGRRTVGESGRSKGGKTSAKWAPGKKRSKKIARKAKKKSAAEKARRRQIRHNKARLIASMAIGAL